MGKVNVYTVEAELKVNIALLVSLLEYAGRWYQRVHCVCDVGSYRPYPISGDSIGVFRHVDFLVYINVA